MIALLPAVLTLASRLVAVPGLHVETAGTGPVVVLVHAFHMDLRQWDGQMPALAVAPLERPAEFNRVLVDFLRAR